VTAVILLTLARLALKDILKVLMEIVLLTLTDFHVLKVIPKRLASVQLVQLVVPHAITL